MERTLTRMLSFFMHFQRKEYKASKTEARAFLQGLAQPLLCNWNFVFQFPFWFIHTGHSSHLEVKIYLFGKYFSGRGRLQAAEHRVQASSVWKCLNFQHFHSQWLFYMSKLYAAGPQK